MYIAYILFDICTFLVIGKLLMLVLFNVPQAYFKICSGWTEFECLSSFYMSQTEGQSSFVHVGQQFRTKQYIISRI